MAAVKATQVQHQLIGITSASSCQRKVGPLRALCYTLDMVHVMHIRCNQYTTFTYLLRLLSKIYNRNTSEVHRYCTIDLDDYSIQYTRSIQYYKYKQLFNNNI